MQGECFGGNKNSAKKDSDPAKYTTLSPRRRIWDQAKQNMKKKQQDQIADQTEVYDKTKHEVKQGLTRYEHLSAIMSLMPDELEQSIAQMVKA